MWDGHFCVCVCAHACYDLCPWLDVVQQQRVGQYQCREAMEKVEGRGMKMDKSETTRKWKRQNSGGELVSSGETDIKVNSRF